MINLTSFIGTKLKSGLQPTTSHQTNPKPSYQQQYNFQKSLSIKQSQNTSQRSLGLSTLLDLQNEQEVFGEFNISRIGAKNSFIKHNKEESKFSSSKNVKNEIEQMREKRKLLEERVNKTLRREEYRNKGFDLHRKEEQRELSISQDGRSYIEKSQISLSKQLDKPSIVIEQYSKELSSLKASRTSQKSQHEKNSSLNSSNTQNLSFVSSSIQKTTKPHKDTFLTYLQKEMYTLKWEKFTKKYNNFKFRFLLKNIKQFSEMEKIMRREEIKLCRFVFVSWKRETKEGVQKNVMIEMIRRRVEQKRAMGKMRDKQIEIKAISDEIQTKQKEQRKGIKNEDREKKSQEPNSMIPSHDYSISKPNSNNQINRQYFHPDSINQNTLQNDSELNIQQISPIKSRPQDQQEIHRSNQASFYSKYSCFTERGDGNLYEEEYIK